MLLNDFLTESSGDISRRWFETLAGKVVPFIDKNGNEWEISDVQYFPPNPSLRYENNENGKSKDHLLRDVANYLRNTYASTNVTISGTGTGAGMLVVLTNTDNDTEKAFLKLFNAKRDLSGNPLFWGTTYFARETGLVPQTAQMKKAAAPLEPSDLIIPGQIYTAHELIESVTKAAKKVGVDAVLRKNLPTLLAQVHTGDTHPIEGLTPYRSIIEVKVSELAAPIAVVAGQLLNGQWPDLLHHVLKPAKYEPGSAAISFPDRQEKLIDSYIHLKDGTQVAISCKSGANGGAKPSTAIIAQTLQEKKDEFDPNFHKKFSDLIETLETLDQKSAIDAPLDLAIKYSIIDKKDADVIKGMYGKGRISDKWLKGKAPHLYLLYKSSSYNPDPSNLEYQTGYHLLAIVARLVAEQVNKDSKRLTQFFKVILSKSNLVQVLAKTRVKGSALCYKDFQVIYPPTFAGIVKLDATSYTSRTKPTRKISFTFEL